MNPKLPRSSSRDEQPNGGTWIAIMAVAACVIGFIGLTSMILPQIQGLIFVSAAFCGFVSLHYFTWGRWLIAKAERERLAEEDDHS